MLASKGREIAGGGVRRFFEAHSVESVSMLKACATLEERCLCR